MRTKIFRFLLIFFFMSFTHMSYGQCYKLVWADEFNYNGAPDPTKWTHEVNGDGGGNNELQYYTDFERNSRVQDSMLIIEAHEENYMGKEYTSARLISHNKASFKYGKMEARIKLPYGQGIWPAFWMLGDNIFSGTGWPACGEIDILEMIGGGEGRDDMLHGTIHWADANGNHAQYGGSKQLNKGIFNDDFHVFSIEWTDTQIKWFLDGAQYHSVSITPNHMSEFHENFFILLNLAVGGNWPGSPNSSTVFPQQMWVDYVRVYQTDAHPEIEGSAEVVAQESNVKFRLVDDPSYAYKWSVPEGAEITAGQGTSSIVVNWGCADDTVKCRLITDCDTVVLTKQVSVKSNQIEGDNVVHTYQKNILYSITPVANSTYQWILPEGVSSAKSDSSAIMLNWGDSDGTLKVEISNSCGTEVLEMSVTAIAQLPYLDQPQNIPGEVRSVYYDIGGEGISYHDTDEGNNGPGIRQDEDVDTEPGDETGNIGWTYPGEWLEYTIRVEDDGMYGVQCRTAGLTRGGSFRFLINGRDITGEIVANTGNSWTNYRSLYIRNIQLFKTDTLLRVEIINGDFNLANMNFSRVSTAINSLNVEDKVFISPTVVSDQLQIKNLPKSSKYTIVNASGKQVKAGIVEPGETILVRGLRQGFYFIVMHSNTNRMAEKFVKIN